MTLTASEIAAVLPLCTLKGLLPFLPQIIPRQIQRAPMLPFFAMSEAPCNRC